MRPLIEISRIRYPESDGKPMGETDLHRTQMFRHIELLKTHFRGQKVYVSGDLLVYYEQGNPKKFIVPDAFVALGLTQRDRRTYRIWTEGKAPEVVIETTSRKTRAKDTNVKPKIYAQIGVKEYFMFDPEGDYLDPPLKGLRLEGDHYVDIELDAGRCLVSNLLKLRICVEDDILQFYRLDNGARLLTAEERAERESEARQRESEARQRESEARQRESEARQLAETEVNRLRAELRQLKP